MTIRTFYSRFELTLQKIDHYRVVTEFMLIPTFLSNFEIFPVLAFY